METKHTPGPWFDRFVSDKTWHKGVYDADGNEVALIKVKSNLVSARRDADASLIASAPDLLVALKASRETLERANEFGGPIADTIWHTGHETLFDFMDAAIAKATGASYD